MLMGILRTCEFVQKHINHIIKVKTVVLYDAENVVAKNMAIAVVFNNNKNSKTVLFIINIFSKKHIHYGLKKIGI